MPDWHREWRWGVVHTWNHSTIHSNSTLHLLHYPEYRRFAGGNWRTFPKLTLQGLRPEPLPHEHSIDTEPLVAGRPICNGLSALGLRVWITARQWQVPEQRHLSVGTPRSTASSALLALAAQIWTLIAS